MLFGRYIKYLEYVLKHKYYVFIACKQNKIMLRGLLHDLSKFRLSELIPYARYFYEPNGDSKTIRDNTGYYKPNNTGNDAFDMAWLYHQKRNKHHWQYWVSPQDNGGSQILEMPDKYVLEMVCDWKGASMAQGYGTNIVPWYEANKNKMVLHPKTRKRVESLIVEVSE